MSTAYAPKDPGGEQPAGNTGRKPDGRFLPGNPVKYRNGGRVKGFAGFAREIQERSGFGQEFLDFAFGVFRDGDAPFCDRWKALEFLVERAYGKAIQPAELQVMIAKEDGQQKKRLPVDKLNKEQLEQWNQLLAIMADAKGDGEGAPQAPIQARMIVGPQQEEQVGEVVDEGRELDAGEAE